MHSLDRRRSDTGPSIPRSVLSSYWANFVRSGDPNGEGLPGWPAFAPDSATTMELGDEMGPRSITELPKLDLLRRLLTAGER